MTSQIDTTVPVFGNPTTQSVRDNFVTAANEISTLQLEVVGSPFLALAGGRMAGPMYLFNDPTDAMMPATKGYVDANAGTGGGGGIPEAPADHVGYARQDGAWVPTVRIGGDTMNGLLVLSGDPTAALGAATKQYTDAAIAAVPPEAPKNANAYGRSNGAWVTVLPLTGGQLSGGVGTIAVPTSPAPFAPSFFSTGFNATTGFRLNAYQSAASTYNYLVASATQPAAALLNLSGTGTVSLRAAQGGAVGAAITWGPALAVDYKGSVVTGGLGAIPTDVTAGGNFYAPMVIVPPSGVLSWNIYTATAGTKYLATGYGAFLWLNTAGSLSCNVVPQGSNGTLVGGGPGWTLDQSGLFNTTGTIRSAAGRINSAGNGNQPSVTVWDTGMGLSYGMYVEIGTGQFCFGTMDGPGNATQGLMHLLTSGIQLYGADIMLGVGNAANVLSFDFGAGYSLSFNRSTGSTALWTNSTAAQTWDNTGASYNIRNCYYGSIGPQGGDNAGYCGYPSQAWFGCNAYAYITVSDPSLKQDVAPVAATDTLDKIAQLAPVHFRWKDSADAATHWGFLAPDVAEVMGADFGGYLKDPESGRQSLAYNDLVAVLWHGVQLLAARVKALEGKRR